VKSAVAGVVTGATEVLLYCLKPRQMFLSFLGTLPKLQKVTISFVVSFHLSAWNILAPTGWLVMAFHEIWGFYESLSIMFEFCDNLRRIPGTVHKDPYTFMIISFRILQEMRYVSGTSRKNQNTYFTFNNFFSWKLFYSWDNVGKYGRARQAADNTGCSRKTWFFKMR